MSYLQRIFKYFSCLAGQMSNSYERLRKNIDVFKNNRPTGQSSITTSNMNRFFAPLH